MNFTLKSGSVVLLRNILAFPGWALTIEEIYKGGKMLAQVIPEVTPAKTAEDDLVPTDLVLDASEVALIKKATEFALSKGGLPCSIFITDILDTLGFAPK